MMRLEPAKNCQDKLVENSLDHTSKSLFGGWWLLKRLERRNSSQHMMLDRAFPVAKIIFHQEAKTTIGMVLEYSV